MQDITKAKCDGVTAGTEGRLIDSRDGKVYWVAKLKDGLCWMTQNLDYTGYGTASMNFASSTQNTAQYYDPGDYVYTRGSSTNNCSGAATATGLGICTDKGWYDVTNMTPSSDPNFPNILDAIDENIYLYNAHYLIGNYYNWIAATNGTGSSATTAGTAASDSVCPTGWSLPLGKEISTGSFGGLLSGLSKGIDITVAPYYFVYGGNVINSTLNSAGSGGYYWSATASSGSLAYSLAFDSSSVDPSYGSSSLYYGYSIRCVAR